MSRVPSDYEYMSFDDFEEALADKPRNERWELIGGRVVKLMVGARWEHGLIVQNIARRINRVGDEWSSLKLLDGLEAVLPLEAIGVSIPLSAIYRRVFPA